MEIIGQANLIVTEQGTMDPNIPALAPLSRVPSNFKAPVPLAQQGMDCRGAHPVECRHENLFIVGGLHARGRHLLSA